MMIDGNKALKTFKDCIDRLCLEPRVTIALKGKGGSLYIRNAFDKSVAPEFTDYDGESLLHLVVEEARALRSDVVVVNPFRLTKKEPPETKKVAAKKATANSGLVRYNADGEAEGQKELTLLRRGFAVGVGVQRVTGDDDEGETFTIHAIDPDGAVHLKRSDPKAKLLRSSFEIFMKKYKLHEVIEVKWKPPNLISSAADFTIFHATAKMGVAMCGLCEQLDREGSFSIRGAPKKGVVSNVAFQNKKMMMPIFGKVFSLEEFPSDRNSFEIRAISARVIEFDGVFGVKVAQAEYEDETYCAAAWMSQSDTKDDCNCIADYLPVALSERQKKIHVADKICDLPYITNISKVAIGDELVLYREKQDDSKIKKAKEVSLKRKVELYRNFEVGMPSGSKARG